MPIQQLTGADESINVLGNNDSIQDFGGSDTYQISPALSGDVVIVDQSPSTIILPAGMTIGAARFTSSGLQFEINGNTLELQGDVANFTFVFGGDPLNPATGTPLSLASTATAFGATIPEIGVAEGTNLGEVKADGTITGGSGGQTPEELYTAAKTAADAAANAATASATAATAAQDAADAAETAVTDAATAAAYKTLADAAKAAADTALSDAQASATAAQAAVDAAAATTGTADDTEAAGLKTTADAAVTAATTAQTVAAAEVVTADAAVAANQPGGNIFLTTLTDVPGGGTGGADTQGTDGGDSYSAIFSTDASSTLQSADSLAAAGGTDSLTVRVISASNSTVSPEASELEEFVINNQTASGAFTLNFANISGETEVTAAQNQFNASTRFDNLDTGTKIRLVDNDGVTNAHFKGDRSASTDDSFDLYIEDSGQEAPSGNEPNALFMISSTPSGGTADTSFETANIETGGTGPSTLDLRGMMLESLVITGDQQLNIFDGMSTFAGLQSVNASGMTGGGLSINAVGSTETSFSFTGSGQADSLQVTRTFLENATTLSLNGGAGMDKLSVNSVTNIASAVNTATNFEMLEITGAVSSLAAGDFTSINTFIFAGQTSNGNRLNISDLEGADRFIFTSDQGQSDETIRFQADSGTSVTFELEAQSGTDGEIRIVTNSNSGNNNGAIGFNNNINAVNIISSGSNAEANVIRAVDNNYNHYAFNNENGPSTFNISGSQALTITAEVGVDLNTEDEFGFEASADVDGSGASGDLRIAGSNLNSGDTIEGGSGDDIFYGLAGDDELTGNGGSDQFRMIDDNDTDTIMDFAAGEDKIGLEQVDFQNTTASTAGTELSMLDYIDNRSSISSLNSSDNQKVVELTSAASGAQIAADTTTTAVEAYVLVFNATSGKGELWYDDNWADTGRELLVVFDNITDLVGLTGLSNTDFVEYLF